MTLEGMIIAGYNAVMPLELWYISFIHYSKTYSKTVSKHVVLRSHSAGL
jgi:hypothetical protein